MTHPDEGERQSCSDSLKNACRGLWTLILQERNFQIQMVFMVVVLVLAAWLDFSQMKWVALLITVSAVLLAEAINTAIESVVDLVEPQEHPLAGKAKDIAAGAVLIASLNSVIIGVLLFGPPLWHILRK